ncbi:MAG: hypothetical protein KF833_01235 [Verrucomicrobiae bacterium]|nr:hypothetical protein [Verrucomicrobiae bacterium]
MTSTCEDGVARRHRRTGVWRALRSIAFGVLALILPLGAAVQAAPAGISLSGPNLHLPARYLLESDPARDRLVVEVSGVIQRNSTCISLGGVIGPCPAQDTPVRITVGLSSGGRPFLTTELTVIRNVPGVASIPFTETLELDPGTVLSDTEEYTLTVTLEHVDDLATGVYVRDATRNFGPYRFAHFTGSILFGEVSATLNTLAAEPVYLGNSQWNLQVGSVTTAQGHTGVHTPATPPPLTVQRNSRGNLQVLAGAVEVGPADAFDLSGWTGQRGPAVLGTNGLTTVSLTLDLPPGLGWRQSNERRLRPTFALTGAAIPLDANLRPVGPASGTSGVPMQFLAETYPVEFESSQWAWRDGVLILTAPSTRYLRQVHYQEWIDTLGSGDLPESNDGVWFLLRPTAASDLVIRPGWTGGITTELRFNPGDFFGHFPLSAVRAAAGGTMRIVNNRVDPEDSTLPGAMVRVLYGKGCRDVGAFGALPEPVQGMQLATTTVRFTPSAGLWAEGDLLPTAVEPEVERHLEIGRNAGGPTHRTDPFARARFYLPGSWVPHADGFDHPGDGNETVDEPGEAPLAFNPARYLLSGLRADQGYALEHPGTAAYLAGAGDYAGFNFRHFAGLQARSRVGGGETPIYPLATHSKYYARLSGVAGIHESSEGPHQLPAYGYDVSLSSFGLSFLGNTPHDSRIDGSVQLPYPTGFAQAFDRLMLNCCGNLTDGQIDPADTQKQLAYWSATRIVTRSLRFTHDPNEPCATDDALLELGITADVAHLDEEPAGFLYPRPDGTLVATDALGRESHLVLSPMVDLAGYPFSAVRRTYFNDYAAFTAGPGWINVAGAAGVSFFRDLTVHGHILGSSATPEPPLFLKGGWAAAGNTFFNQAGFDANHRGYPPGQEVEAYRTGNTHLPRAQQVWFGTVPFDYAVRFDPLTRSFRSPEPEGIDLVVLGSDSEVERLNAELADLRFSAFLNLSLLAAPELLVEEGASWITGHLENAAVESIRAGLDRLAALLDSQIRQLLDEVILPALEQTVVVPLVAQLPANGAAAAIDAALDEHLGDPLSGTLSGLADAADAALNLTDQASQALSSAIGTLETVRQVLMTLQQAETLIVAGLEAVGIDVDALPAGLRDEVLAELEFDGGPGVGAVGRLLEIREAIAELEVSIGQLIAALEQGQMFFAQLRDTVFTPLAEYVQMSNLLKQRIGTWLKGGYGHDPGAYSVEELRARVRLELRDAFAATPVSANLQAVFRSWVYNTDSAVRSALDTAFQAINDQIVAIAMVALEELIDAIQPVKSFSSVVESVNWDGRAQIRGDRLTQLRIDNRAVINLPTPVPGVQIPVEFTGFYQFRELTSDGPVGCWGGVPGRVNEILLGSSLGPASMFGGSRITVQSKFTRTEDGELLQLAGGLELEQQGFSMPGLGLQEFSATLSIGPAVQEFYVSAWARGGFGIGNTVIDTAGGVVIGRTCTFDAFSWDPDAGFVLGGPVGPGHAFTGIYVFGEATVPMASLACLYRGSVTAGIRAWVQDSNYDFANVEVGGRLEGGVSAEYLCLVKVRGSAFLQGGISGGLYRYVGGAELSGKVGICPLCVGFDVGIQAEHVEGQGWNLND